MPYPIDIGMDGHVHTKFCNHASGEMEDYVLAALDRGLHTICFLEHLETDIIYQQRSWLTNDNFTEYFREGERLKDRYHDCIDILLGVEVGYNPDSLTRLQHNLSQFQWDRIGLSYHFYRSDTTHLNMLSGKKESLDQFSTLDIDGIITHYYATLLEAVIAIDCDVVCHLDTVLRHHPAINHAEKHHDHIIKILDTMSKKNIALEINTSGFALRNTPFPAADIIREAMQRKIPLCLGSDAHGPHQVGRFFSKANAYINEINM